MPNKQKGSKSKPKSSWVVEKFSPEKCPKCQRIFGKEIKDYVLFLGDIIDGEKKGRETHGYDIIRCSECKNFTARFQLESYRFKEKSKAKEKMKEGFVNLQEYHCFGNTPRDAHVVMREVEYIKI